MRRLLCYALVCIVQCAALHTVFARAWATVPLSRLTWMCVDSCVHSPVKQVEAHAVHGTVYTQIANAVAYVHMCIDFC